MTNDLAPAPAKGSLWTRPLGWALIGLFGVVLGVAVALAISNVRYAELSAEHDRVLSMYDATAAQLDSAQVTIQECQDSIAQYKSIANDIVSAYDSMASAVSLAANGDLAGATAAVTNGSIRYDDASSEFEYAGTCG